MIPDLGSGAIIVAICFALLQSIVPLGLKFNNSHLVLMNRMMFTAALMQFVLITFAMICLMISFIGNDMTVLFVRQHSHMLLPIIYRMGAAWSGHEGSLLLWCLCLSFWTAAFAIFHNKNLSKLSVIYILMILGWMSVGFLLFLLLTSNPFLRDFPAAPIVGNDLVPLLQDPGLFFHPPLLYLGYVGFVISFSFAICALIEGKCDASWVKSCRPWIILPWVFLGCGIILGSWWAYRELGWGGWWFWDPVENASLLPWLIATALIHSLIVTEKRGAFKGWTILLAITVFCLSLIGTFLVRSGILVSVHAFASDPMRGLFLLIYLTFIIGGALLFYAMRIKYFYQTPQFNIISRETILLINSVVLFILMITILMGTLYPLIFEILSLEKISVGEPYFNTVFLPIMLPLLILMGCVPHFHWGNNKYQLYFKKIIFTLFLSLLLSIVGIFVLGFPFQWLATMGIFVGIWIILSTLKYAITKINENHYLTHKNVSMIIAHSGLAIMLLGITINKSYSEERQVKISPGESIFLSKYQFTFINTQEISYKNYESIRTNFTVKKNGYSQKYLSAEQRIYRSHEQIFNKPGIVFNGFRDIYLTLGNVFPDGSWSIRIYYKPCVRWIWIGGFLVLAGGLLTLVNKLGQKNECI